MAIADVYTVRLAFFNLVGPIDTIVFTAPALGRVIIRWVTISPTMTSGFAALYIKQPGSGKLIHIVRQLTGDGQTYHFDMRVALEPGEELHASLATAGMSMNGQVTGFLFD